MEALPADDEVVSGAAEAPHLRLLEPIEQEDSDVVEYRYGHIAASNLLGNRQPGQRHISPSRSKGGKEGKQTHYGNVYHDALYHAVALARHNDRSSLDAAQEEVRVVAEGQLENGDLPFYILKQLRDVDPEITPQVREQGYSNYSLPPFFGPALSEIETGLQRLPDVSHEEARAEIDALRQEIVPVATDLLHHYGENYSFSPEDKRVWAKHPHQTGNDRDPTHFDIFWHPPRFLGSKTPKWLDKVYSSADYIGLVHFNHRKLAKADGDLEKERALNVGVDLSLNSLLVVEAGSLAVHAAAIGMEDDAAYLQAYADNIEHHILTKMWDPTARAGAGMFFAQKNDGEPKKEISSANLATFMLEGLSHDQLEGNLDALATIFNTPRMIPSVPTDSKWFDPHHNIYDRFPLGGVWIWTNFKVVEHGLVKHIMRADLLQRPDLLGACYYWANRITKDSFEMVNEHGPWEFYGPLDGKPQRKRVEMFGASNLGLVISIQRATHYLESIGKLEEVQAYAEEYERSLVKYKDDRSDRKHRYSRRG